MRNPLLLLILLFSTISFSQGIIVDTTSLSIPQLVQNELMQNSCSNETNFVFSSHIGIGQFTNTNAGFPISDGIIIRNGIAKHTEGPYTGINESSQITTSGDADLQAISNSTGQTAIITDVAFIQFDFTPISTNFSFDFLFASNEYGQHQCDFSDVFTFLLTDLTTGITTNLAVIPGTTTPVSVKNIRDAAYNANCSSANANLFSRYNVANPAISAINMRGETVLLTAASPVIPNRTYRIKLAIGDYLDSQFDSAVFIKGGSFTTTTNLGPDQTICQGESIILDSGLGPQFNHVWTLNGNPIPGATNPTLIVTQAGMYGITATLPASGCLITDEILISDLQTNNPNNLTVCNTGQPTYQYDLTQNNLGSLGVNPTDYSIMYFASLANATAGGPQIPAGQLSNYTSTGNQTIYIKFMHITNGNAICDNLLSFNLLISAAFTTTAPPTLNSCSNASGTVNLTVQNGPILNGQNPANFSISYFTSQSDAQNDTNVIINPNAFPITLAQSPQVIWVRMEDASNQNCFKIVNFTIIIHPLPVVSTINGLVECSNFTLQPIPNGTYYTGPNGTGTQLNPGDIIDTTGTYYIFTGPDANGCTNQSSFNAYFIDEYVIPLGYCGSFTVPPPPHNVGAFYTASGGPNGTGTLIPTGTQFINSTQLTQFQTVYYYSEINNIFCRDEQFDISIYPIPLVDDPADVTTCDSYSLPPLTNGFYFIGSGGTGMQLNPGDTITTSQTIYVFNSNANCTDENPFTINIVDTSLFQAVTSCGSYTLPPITFGGYYTAPSGSNGTGTLLDPNIAITTSQIVYYYADTSTLPNCTDNLNYDITINAKPPVDTIASATYCGELSLPSLTNGTYYTLSGGPSVAGQVQLNPGDIIGLTATNLPPGTYYIYSGPDTFGCFNETSFTINLNPYPLIDSTFDNNRVECNPYSIPQPLNGTVYNAPGGPAGTGNIVSPTDVFSTTQTFYLYNIDNNTGCTIDKPFTVIFTGLNLPDYQDIKACEFDNYTLPALTHTPPTPFNYSIGYFYQQGGVDPVPNNTVFNTPNTQTTIWVYAINGNRIICIQEDSFVIDVAENPVLPAFSTNNEYCGSYTLPALPIGNYNVNYYSQAGGVGLITPANYTYSTPGTYTVYVYATALNNINCNDETQFYFTIYPLNDLIIDGGAICVDFTTGALLNAFELVSGLDPAIFTVEWYLNGVLMGTGTSYTAIQEGTYDVVIIKNTPDIGNDCGYNPTSVTVEKSSAAIATVTVTGAFEDDIDIIVNVTGGFGIYEYQMDNGPFQTDNIFHDAPSGQHIITIRDTKGDCGDIILIAIVLKYPNYFTPNADGIHDTWNIFDLADQPNAIINIFDRYGKFIKQQSPTELDGWDGTYNGQPLPSADYWFQVFYKNNGIDQEFKAHFSMKR